MSESSLPAKSSFALQFLFYTLFRLGLWLLISVIILGFGLLIDLRVPILVALLLGIFIATPLSFVLGKTLRNSFLIGIITMDSQRRKKRLALLEQLQVSSGDHVESPTDIDE